MKQVILTTSFPKNINDYSGLFVYNYLKNSNIESIVIAPHTKNSLEYEEWGNIKIIRIKYAPVEFENLFYLKGVPDNLNSNPFLSLLAIPWLLKSSITVYQNLNKGDLLITNWAFPTGIIGAFIKFIKKDIEHLNIIHSAGITILKNKKLRFFTKFLNKYTDKLHFVNTEHILWFENLINKKLNKEKIILKPMPVEAKKSYGENNKKNILYLGRIVKIKGLNLMLDELSSLRNINITVAGDGDLKSELEKKYIYAKFTGSVFGKKKEVLLNNSGIVIVPSVSQKGQIEGFPTVLLEGALSRNLLIISREIKGIDYIFKNNINCYYYNPYKKGELKSIIENINEKKMEAMLELSYNATLKILESYNIECFK